MRVVSLGEQECNRRDIDDIQRGCTRFYSAILGVLGGTIICGATELPKQEERVAKGMFPANPRRQARAGAGSPGPDDGEGSET
ncbi:DUF4491 family protein [Chloroflexota bacterium]